MYLPGNGGLLTAVAMMAAGWDGAPDVASSGIPKERSLDGAVGRSVAPAVTRFTAVSDFGRLGAPR